MPDNGPVHPLTYRQEIVAPLFALINSGESAAIVGAASMGKSRLLQFLLRADVQEHYLNANNPTWIIVVDCNRLAELSEWGLYELMFTSLMECGGARLERNLRNWFTDLRREVITSANLLLARRHIELVTRILCLDQGIRLCFVFDEFDEIYSSVPASGLANLRAIRDIERYAVCYFLLMRDHPARLREPDDHEGFYELYSRSALGLCPYQEADARRVITQIGARRGFTLTSEQEDEILYLSGGHPGLLVALCDILIRHDGDAPISLSLDWAVKQPTIIEESRKLWNGLAQDERLMLSRFAHDVNERDEVWDLLTLKGLIRFDSDDAANFFSPVFRTYVKTGGELSETELWIDKRTATVWIEGKRISGLSRLEFELLCHLHAQVGHVYSRADLIEVLYPDETANPELAGNENRIDSLVRHLRKAIEPVPDRPRYLLTVRGHGYKLVDKPEEIVVC